MAIVMTNKEFVAKLEKVAKNYKTLYVMGCIGAPLNASNKERYCKIMSTIVIRADRR